MLKVIYMLRFSEEARQRDPFNDWIESHRPLYGHKDIRGYVQNACKARTREPNLRFLAMDGFSACWFTDRDQFSIYTASAQAEAVAKRSERLFDLEFLVGASGFVAETVLGTPSGFKLAVALTGDVPAAFARALYALIPAAGLILNTVLDLSPNERLFESAPRWTVLIEVWFSSESLRDQWMDGVRWRKALARCAARAGVGRPQIVDLCSIDERIIAAAC